MDLKNKHSLFSTFNISLILSSIVGALVIPTIVLAIGVNPGVIEVENLLQHSSVSRVINVSRSNPSEDMVAKATLSGPAAGAIRLTNNGLLKMPKGQNIVPYTFYIEPGTLGSGKYEVSIAFSLMSAIPVAQKSGSQLVAGAKGDIRFNVITDQIEKFEIKNVVVQDSEESVPLTLTYLMVNQGNVDTKPSRIEVTLTDESDAQHTVSKIIAGEAIKDVKALSEENVILPLQTALEVGTYKTHVRFYKNDEMIHEASNLVVNIYPRGTLAQKGELESFQTDKPSYKKQELVTMMGTFKNTGSIGLNAELTINMFHGGERVDSLTVDPVFVPVGSSYTFEKTYRPSNAGTYRAVASSHFGINKTEDRVAEFSVPSDRISTLMVVGILILITILFGFILVKIVKRSPPVSPS